MLDFRIETFLTLCELLNYTKAAKKLCITQPAVTQHIKYLENKYHTKLFSYEVKRLNLTRQGILLKEAVISIKADEQKLSSILSQSEVVPPHISFGVTRTIGEYLMPEKLNLYLTNNTSDNLTMIVENTSTLISLLRDGSIDFAIVEGYFNKNDYTYKLISREKFIGVCGTEYPLKNCSYLSDLISHPLLIREKGSGTREILERILKEHNLSTTDFSRNIEIGNISTIKYLLKNNHGISFLYETAVREDIRNGVLQKIPIKDFNVEWEFNFICLKGSIFYEDYLEQGKLLFG